MAGSYGGITTFGSYTFPNTLQEFRDNFSDIVPQTRRLPGIDGAFSEDGESVGQAPTGTVTVGFYLVAYDRADMDAKRDAVSAMVDYGLAKLTYQPTKSANTARFCWARVNNIQMSERKSEHDDLHQKVAVVFQVEYPHWLVADNMPWTLGDGSALNDVGLTIGSGGHAIAASGTSTSDTITNDGNTTAIAIVSILPGAGNSCQNPTIQRIKNSASVEYWKYTGTVGATDELIVDGKNHRVELNAVAAWTTFEYSDIGFLHLEPGNNTIKVLFANAGDQATVTVWFWDEWR